MKTITGYPPNIDKIQKVFPNLPDSIVFTYGKYIYKHIEEELPEHLLVHEAVHSKQQGDLPETWWDTYLKDPIFRLSQELEAYRAQYKWIKENSRGSKFQKSVLFLLAKDLCDFYNLSLTQGEAESKIRNGV